MGNITQLKQGSLSGLRRQTNECLDSAYNKGYEDGAKNQDEVQYQRGYNKGLENGKADAIYNTDLIDELKQAEHDKGYNSAINDYNAMYEWLHDCFEDFEKFLLEKRFYTDEKFSDGFVVGQLMYDLICDHDIAEVISEFKVWQEEKKKADEEIIVGDEIESVYSETFGVVTNVNSRRGRIIAVFSDGTGATMDLDSRNFKKTGRHFDEIEKILDKLRGENNE